MERRRGDHKPMFTGPDVPSKQIFDIRSSVRAQA
jgi:hypothetical protein